MNRLVHSKFCLLSFISLFGMMILQGCSVYSFTGQGIAGIETIAVEPFENLDPEFGIVDELIEAVIQRLLNDRTYTLANISTADAVLRGKITDVDDRTLSFNADETATENQVRIVLEVEIVKPGQTEPLKATRLVCEASYPYITGSVEEREEGIQRAIDQLVLDLFNWLTSDW